MSTDRGIAATAGVVIRFAVATALLGYLYRRYDLQATIAGWDARVGMGLLLALVTLLIAQLLSAARWRIILGSGAPRLATLLRIYLIGSFFSLFLPTSVGGDAARAVAVTPHTGNGARAASSVVLDRVMGMIALLALFALGLVLQQTSGVATGGTGGFRLDGGSLPFVIAIAVLGAALTGAVLRWSGRARRVLGEASSIWLELARSPRRAAAALGVGLLVQLAYVLAWYQLAWSMSLPVPPLALLVYVPFVSLAAMVPITVSGLGVREGAWTLLLRAHEVDPGAAAGLGILYFVAMLGVGALGGAALLFPAVSRTSATSRAASLSQL